MADDHQSSAASRDADVRAALDLVVRDELWSELLSLIEGREDEFFFGSVPFDADECRYTLDGAPLSIRHSGKTLAQLLGPGSEVLLPSDDAEMPASRQAAALIVWARRRLRRSLGSSLATACMASICTLPTSMPRCS